MITSQWLVLFGTMKWYDAELFEMEPASVLVPLNSIQPYYRINRFYFFKHKHMDTKTIQIVSIGRPVNIYAQLNVMTKMTNI